MTNDLNNDQAVTDPSLEAGAAPQQDLNNDGSVDQNQDVLADGTPVDKKVPYTELQKATEAKKEAEEARKKAEEQAAYAQRQLELMSQTAQPQQTQTQLTNEDRALQDLGITADDLYGENFIKYEQRVNQLRQEQSQQSQALMADRQFILSHPDVSQVVGTINPATGQLLNVNTELYDIIAKKPYLTAACGTIQGAYEVVMQERKIAELESKTQVNQQHDAQRQVDVATAPLGGSAAGGGGGGVSQGQDLLSREQVAQIDADIAAGKYRQ